MQTFNIKVTDKAPSMSQTKTIIHVESFDQAVGIARRLWLEKRRALTLCSGTHGMFFLFDITADGVFTNNNNPNHPVTGNII